MIEFPAAVGKIDDPRAYQQMAQMIRKVIANGTLKAGDPAPSATALAREQGHSRQTCGRALQMLEEEGLVVRYPGLGYFVAKATRARPRGAGRPPPGPRQPS